MTMTILAVTKCIILKHPSVITGKNFLRNMYMQNMSSISRDIQKISFKILRKSIVPKNVLKNWVAWNKAAINKPHIQPYIFSGRGKPLILEEREKGVAFFPPFASSSIYGFVFLFSTLCIMHLYCWQDEKFYTIFPCRLELVVICLPILHTFSWVLNTEEFWP